MLPLSRGSRGGGDGKILYLIHYLLSKPIPPELGIGLYEILHEVLILIEGEKSSMKIGLPDIYNPVMGHSEQKS